MYFITKDTIAKDQKNYYRIIGGEYSLLEKGVDYQIGDNIPENSWYQKTNYNNVIGDGVNQFDAQLINKNRSTLNKITQKDNQLYFNNKRIGNPISILQTNSDSSNSSSSESSFLKKFENVEKINFHGARIQLNPYDSKQVFVYTDKLSDIIDEESHIITSYFNIVNVNYEEYRIKNKDFVICNVVQNGTTIKLPFNAQDKNYIKIATLQNINAKNIVRICSIQDDVYISKNKNYILDIDTPYSSIQMIYDQPYRIWRVITPFVPIQRNTNGVTKQQVSKMAKQIAKKYLNIFG